MSNQFGDAELTAAVDAATRKAFDLTRCRLVELVPPDEADLLPQWETLEPVDQLKWRQHTLAIVWAALGALPDRRWTLWEEGCAAARRLNPQNPYPPPSA